MAITLDGSLGILSPDFEPSSSTTPTNGLFLPTTNALGFATNSTERLRLDASGNLGLGVTPLSSGTTAFEVKGGGDVAFQGNGNISANAYYSSGSYKYATSSTAVRYNMNGASAGGHAWFTAASGTAGNAISFTQAMTLNASGNLGIGTSSPASPFEVAKSASIDNAGATNKWLARLRDTTATAAGVGGGLLFQGIKAASGSVGNFAAIAGLKENATDNNENGYLAFFTTPTATGLLNERARIDSSGNLIVGGTTSYGGKLQSTSTYIRSADGSSSQGCGFVSSDFAGNEWHFGRNTANGYYYVVRQTGTGMYMNTNAWVATSDSRAKKNVQNLESSLDKVTALRPVRFDWISDDTQDVGFIAQEVLPLIPEAVDVQEDPEAMMGISKERMIPFLVKAIQELTARLEALEAK